MGFVGPATIVLIRNGLPWNPLRVEDYSEANAARNLSFFWLLCVVAAQAAIQFGLCDETGVTVSHMRSPNPVTATYKNVCT